MEHACVHPRPCNIVGCFDNSALVACMEKHSARWRDRGGGMEMDHACTHTHTHSHRKLHTLRDVPSHKRKNMLAKSCERAAKPHCRTGLMLPHTAPRARPNPNDRCGNL